MASAPLFLITGATGKTGGVAARVLLEKGHRVRVLVRSEDGRSARLQAAGAEVVLGDLLDLPSVRKALDGVTAAYFVYPIQEGLLDATARFAQAAVDARVSAVVNMSQISAKADATSTAALNHWLSEHVLDWSGLAVTHLRPTFFAEWLLYLAKPISSGAVQLPFSTSRHAPIAAADQGRVIAAILQNPAPHRGAVYPLFGPVELSWPEIVSITADALDHPVRYQEVPVDAFLAAFGSARKDPEYFKQHIGQVIAAHKRGEFAGTNSLVKDITGQEAMTVAEFAQQNRLQLTTGQPADADSR